MRCLWQTPSVHSRFRQLQATRPCLKRIKHLCGSHLVSGLPQALAVQ